MGIPGRTGRSSLLLLGVLALALAGCGTSGDNSRAARGSDLPEDEVQRQIVESGTIRLDDLPAGFTAEDDEDADENDSDFDDEIEDLPVCAALRNLDEAALGSANSPDFETRMNASVSNSVEIYSDVAKVDELQALLTHPDTLECLKTAFQRGFEREIADDQEAPPVRGVTVDVAPSAPGAFGDDTDALTMLTRVDFADRTVNLFMDLVVVKVGKTQTSYTFMAPQPGLVAALGPQVITTTVDRLRAAGA